MAFVTRPPPPSISNPPDFPSFGGSHALCSSPPSSPPSLLEVSAVPRTAGCLFPAIALRRVLLRGSRSCVRGAPGSEKSKEWRRNGTPAEKGADTWAELQNVVGPSSVGPDFKYFQVSISNIDIVYCISQLQTFTGN
jgi:hypothetical protein